MAFGDCRAPRRLPPRRVRLVLAAAALVAIASSACGAVPGPSDTRTSPSAGAGTGTTTRTVTQTAVAVPPADAGAAGTRGARTTGPPTLVAAGDIACGRATVRRAGVCAQGATSDLALRLHPTAVLPLGDDQYDTGALADFRADYAPTWGRLDTIAHPVPGNHEYGAVGTAYRPTGAAGYFAYFGRRVHPRDPRCARRCQSWYSYDLGAWHLIALDSQCGEVGGCTPGRPEYTWLVDDLETHHARCTLAYWHIPLFSSSDDHEPAMQAVWQLLQADGVDVVLTGHAHLYERFAPQDAAGDREPRRGMREFVVGTGGRSHTAFTSPAAPNSQRRIAGRFGVLRLTLHAAGYSWAFFAVGASAPLDTGWAACH